MNGSIVILIAGAAVAILGVVIWVFATRRKPERIDPIAATTGANRGLTGTRNTGGVATLAWDEALRRFVAFTLDDAPREALSKTPDPAHAPVFESVAAILTTLEARPEYIPRRPSLLPKLMATVNDSESSVLEISRIIAQDPALTGNLLRIANSPFYKVGGSPIESIDRAVTLVGVQGLRSVIASALLQPLMAAGAGIYSRFPEFCWDHTLYSAVTAEAHATQIERAEPFISQLVGLLYGLSAIVVFRIARDQFAARPGLIADPGSMARLLETWVPPTAGRIAVSWELSERIQYALESQTLALELQMENSLGRSLKFGRVTGALLMLCRLGRITESEAKAILVAGAGQGAHIDRLWDRFAIAYLSNQPA